jgi:RNA polymerase sigma factor (sigma-70 family)
MLTTRDALSTEPLLTREEEVALAFQVEAGLLAGAARCRRSRVADGTDADAVVPDAQSEELEELVRLGEEARQRFIRANLRLVAKLARQTALRSQVSESDLFQEGCLGLIHAVERFDYRRGYKFSTYATFWVQAYVRAAAANSFGALNLPTARASQLRLARGVEVELAQTLGRAASMLEVSISLGRSERWTAALLAHQAPQSFDGLEVDALDVPALPGSWGEVGVLDRWPGGELLWRLEGLERDVLGLRYGFTDGTAHSYAEISRRLAITVSRARRLELHALEELRSICPSGAAVHL